MPASATSMARGSAALPRSNVSPGRDSARSRAGDVEKPLEPASPGALGCVSGVESNFNVPADAGEGARRVALADWIASPNLSKVDEIGFADLMPGSGHGQGGWSDVGKIEVYAKPVKRDQ